MRIEIAQFKLSEKLTQLEVKKKTVAKLNELNWRKNEGINMKEVLK